MKMRCYFFLNIKHGASKFYWGRPPNINYEAQEGGGMEGPLLGPGGGASLGPRRRPPPGGGGLQLSSAGTVPHVNVDRHFVAHVKWITLYNGKFSRIYHYTVISC